MSDPELRVTVVRDEAGLQALRPAWESLEAQAEEDGLYVTWGYVSRAWRFLAAPGDGLWVLAVHEVMDTRAAQGAQRLVGVLPLVRVVERHHGMRLRVLRHLGIWEGDRPGLLALRDADRVWQAVWDHLVAERREWHVLDLRELDDGCWPLRALRQPGRGFSSEIRPDIEAPFQRLDQGWPHHETTRPEAVRAHHQRAWRRPDLRITVAETPEDIGAAFGRYLALERALVQAGTGVTLGGDPRRVAFYLDWLPRLAARGDAAVWLLEGGEGLSAGVVGGLIRLRCGGAWIERHACHDPARAGETPTLLLAVEALRRSFGQRADECALVNVGDPEGAVHSVLDWFDGRRRTQRLAVRNLRSRLGPVVALKGLKGLATLFR